MSFDPDSGPRSAAPALAAAFGATFWAAAALIATALIPALLLPRAPREQHAASAPATEPAKAA